MPANSEIARYLAGSCGLALAYLAVGLLSMGLAIPPIYSTPLYPAAGLALAAMLSLGARHAPGLFVGAVAINVVISHMHGVPSLTTSLLAGGRVALQGLFCARA